VPIHQAVAGGFEALLQGITGGVVGDGVAVRHREQGDGEAHGGSGLRRSDDRKWAHIQRGTSLAVFAEPSLVLNWEGWNKKQCDNADTPTVCRERHQALPKH
jgi:hypothetical protein